MANKLSSWTKNYQNKIRWTCRYAILTKFGWQCIICKGAHYCRECDKYQHKNIYGNK